MNEEILNAILNELSVTTDNKTILAFLEEHPKYSNRGDDADPTETIEIIMEDYPRLFDHIEMDMPVYKNDRTAQKERFKSKYNPGKSKHNNGSGITGGASRQSGIDRAHSRHQVKKFEGVGKL